MQQVFGRQCLGLRPACGFPDGFPELWELPCHGWHENILKNNTHFPQKRMLLWPTGLPDAVPPSFVSIPHEEFAVHRVFIDEALAQGYPHVLLIWHPWSLGRFDPRISMLELTFEHVRKLGIPCTTFAGLLEALKG